MKSLINNKKICYICGKQYSLHKHHIFKGVRNRKKADEDGLWVYLCYEHHEGTNGVHGKNGKGLDLKLKKIAEKKWIEFYKEDIDNFIRRYGKNYL